MAWVTALRRGAKALNIKDVYTIGKEIGRGRFSTVHIGTHKRTGKKYAIKVIDKSHILNDADQEALRTEIAVLKLVRHPHIVKLVDLFESIKKIYIVMQLLPAGDMFDRIIKRKFFTEQTARIITWRLLSALKYLHALGIVHRCVLWCLCILFMPLGILNPSPYSCSDRSDLKPENILMVDFEEDTNIVISDFGLSKFASPTEVMNMPCGTLAYAAPEVLKLEVCDRSIS